MPAKVSLIVDCESDTPAVLADAAAVTQILLSLCSNALHAVQEQVRPGVIEVRLEARTQGEATGSLSLRRYACLMVRDNGSGMDEATRARIFEPFFTTKPVGMATGLGLSVVHRLVQGHEASIEVDSTPGMGTTFRIYFPAAEALVREITASSRTLNHSAKRGSASLRG
jgi:signal transduction histidine kinase